MNPHGTPDPAQAEAFGTRHNPPPSGLLDRFVRRFGVLSHMLAVLALYAVAATAIGVALAPALWLLDHWLPWSRALDSAWTWPAMGVGFGLAAFLTGFSLLVVVPVYNLLLPTRIKPFKGGYYSIGAVPWCLHNGLFYLVRYTFLPYVTLTPFGPLFLRAMGMRIGARAFINTEFISDPALITVGDDAAIGGSVHLFAHYGGGGHLTIAPVTIGARSTIGQKATVMGDVEVGPDATVLPHSVLLPGTRVGAGETWGGVPAHRIDPEEMDRIHRDLHGVTAPTRRIVG